MIGSPHILSVTDVQRGLQALVSLLLNDISDVPTVIEINQLAPPYLSTNPSEAYGVPLSTSALSSPLDAGSTSMLFPNQPQGINQMYISYAGTSGLIAEAVPIQSYDGQTITFVSGTQNSYPRGSLVQLFNQYSIGNTRVLLPGQTILLPVADNGSLTINGSSLADTLGSDFALFPMSFSNGDFSYVQGVQTLSQRIKIVIQTAIHSLPLHPSFGDRLQQAVGSASNSVKWAAYVRQAVMQLPEVSDVKNLVVTAVKDQLIVSGTVIVNTSNTQIQLYDEVFSLAA